MVVKKVSQILGITLLLVGLGSVLFEKSVLNGLLYAHSDEIMMHLLTGVLLVGVGFLPSKKWAGGTMAILSAIYLTLGITALVFPHSSLAGASPLHELMRLAIGVIGLITVIMSRWNTRTALT